MFEVEKWRRAIVHAALVTSLAAGSTPGTEAQSAAPGRISAAIPARPKLILQFGHSNTVESLSFSPDGKILATGSSDRTVKLWDIQTGECRHTLQGHSNTVSKVIFSSDGKTLASRSADGVRLWNVATGNLLHRLTEAGSSVAFGSNGEMLTMTHGWLSVWPVQAPDMQGKLTRTLMETGSSLIALAPNGMQALINRRDADHYAMNLYDLQTGLFKQLPAQQLPEGADLQVVAFSPDGKKLAMRSDKTVQLRDGQTGELLHTLTEHTEEVRSLVFSPDSQVLVSLSPNQMRLWDTRSGALTRSLENGSCYAVALSPDGKMLAADSEVWDVPAWKLKRRLPTSAGSVSGVAFTPDGKFLVSGSVGWGGTANVWNVRTGELMWTLTGQWNGLTRFTSEVALAADGHTLAMVAESETALWDIRRRKLLHVLKGHQGTVTAIAFSVDSQTFASSSDDSVLKLWNVQTGELKHTLPGYEVSELVFTPDGKTLGGIDDEKVLLWDTKDGRLKHSINCGTWLKSIAFSPDGTELMSVFMDGTFKLWDPLTGQGKRMSEVPQLGTPLRDSFFASTGRLLVNRSHNMVHLWNIPVTSPEQVLPLDGTWLSLVAFSPAAKALAAIDSDGSIGIWSTQSGRLLARLMALHGPAAHEETPVIDGSLPRDPVSIGWMTYTPAGYYIGSREAARYIRWKVGDQLFPAAKYAKTFHRPDLVEKALSDVPLAPAVLPEKG